MHAGLYAHPQDLEARAGGLAALRDSGWSEVALATAYHAGRWLTPAAAAAGGGLVRFLEDGIVHFRPESGTGGTLAPQASRDVERTDAPDSPLVRFCREAGDVGLEATAWVVLFHNSRLGRAHPVSCVRNALGDVYEYALCPARDEVRAYGREVLAGVAAHRGLHAVELEAAGFMGHKHGSHHDKSSFTLPRHLDFLLSYCFCDACVAALHAHGVDGGAVRDAVAALLRRELGEADALDGLSSADALSWLHDAIGAAAVTALLAHRVRTYRLVLEELRACAPLSLRLALHVKPDPLFTGSQMGVGIDDVADLVDEVVSTHYGEDPAAIASAWQGGAPPTPLRLAFWPKAPQFCSDDDVRRVIELARGLGCSGLRVYHLGLLPPRTVERVARLL